MYSIRPESGWDEPQQQPPGQGANRPVQYVYSLEPRPTTNVPRSSLPWAGIVKTMAIASVLAGLIGAASISKSEVSFPVQALIDSVIIFLGLLAAAFVLVMYFLPTYKAFQNHKRLSGIIGVLNFFFGWTLIGWWLLLAWGSTPEKEDWQSMRIR